MFDEGLVSVERKSERENGRMETYSYEPVMLFMNTWCTKLSMEHAIRSSPPAQSDSVSSSRSLPDISCRAAIENILLSIHGRSFVHPSVKPTELLSTRKRQKKTGRTLVWAHAFLSLRIIPVLLPILGLFIDGSEIGLEFWIDVVKRCFGVELLWGIRVVLALVLGQGCDNLQLTFYAIFLSS
jgi:hypothetical protein